MICVVVEFMLAIVVVFGVFVVVMEVVDLAVTFVTTCTPGSNKIPDEPAGPF